MDITTALYLSPELPSGDLLVQCLREVAEYGDLGAETWMLPGIDLEPYAQLHDAGMVTWTYEPSGVYGPDGRTEMDTLIIRITEDGLSELVVHGRER